MPSIEDSANARELTRMVASYVVHKLSDADERACRKAARISASTWMAYFDGAATMSLPVIVALSRALGMRPSELLAAAEVRHGG